MRAIHLLFYRPDTDDMWLNHVVAFASPPYSHCDIQFEDGMASSIYQNESVYLKMKQFSRTNYERLSITTTDEEYYRIRAFCEKAHASKTRFDTLGMYMSYTPFGGTTPQTKTFCSRYIAEALMSSGRDEFRTLSPTTTTPSSLHRIITSTGRSFIHIGPNRLDQLRA